MGISFDKIDGSAWLTFDVQPHANPVTGAERATKLENPGFGRVFSDHMAIVRYNQAKGGWYEAHA